MVKYLLNVLLVSSLLTGCHSIEVGTNKEETANLTINGKGDTLFTIESYKNSIKANLEQHSDELTAKLAEVSQLKYDGQVELLDFSASIEPTRYELTITMFSMDNEGNEVFGEDSAALFSGSLTILDEASYYQESVEKQNQFMEFYEENEADIVQAEQDVIKDWFLRSLKNAADSKLPLQAYLSFHDEYKSYDLVKNVWISEDEMWSY